MSNEVKQMEKNFFMKRQDPFAEVAETFDASFDNTHVFCPEVQYSVLERLMNPKPDD